MPDRPHLLPPLQRIHRHVVLVQDRRRLDPVQPDDPVLAREGLLEEVERRERGDLLVPDPVRQGPLAPAQLGEPVVRQPVLQTSRGTLGQQALVRG